MGRSEKQLDPQSGPLARLAVDLRELRRQAGGPTYREMSRTAGYSPSALSAAASGGCLPSRTVLASYVKACGGDVEEWLRRRDEIACAPTAISGTASDTRSEPGTAPVIPAVRADDSTPGPALRPGARVPVRHRLARRGAGLLAAAVVGSMATVVPMAVWGAPSCLTGHGHTVSTVDCRPTSNP